MIQFNKFRSIKNKVDESKLSEIDQNIQTIGDQLKEKFNEAKRWELRTAFLRDTEERIRERIEKIQK
jgi:hypothetical protein